MQVAKKCKMSELLQLSNRGKCNSYDCSISGVLQAEKLGFIKKISVGSVRDRLNTASYGTTIVTETVL